MKLYHNPRCSKSRATRELLEGRAVEIIEYLQNPLTVEELRDLCTLLSIAPHELLRKGEAEHKELVATHGEPDDTRALQWMHEHPILMERPIFVNGTKAVIGRPPENVKKIL